MKDRVRAQQKVVFPIVAVAATVASALGLTVVWMALVAAALVACVHWQRVLQRAELKPAVVPAETRHLRVVKDSHPG